MRPASASTHFECVPGSRKRPEPLPSAASAPKTCVSSPRITSRIVGARRLQAGHDADLGAIEAHGDQAGRERRQGLPGR